MRTEISNISVSSKILAAAKNVIFVAGGFGIAALAVGIVSDGLNFDQTRGGYDAPYEGWTGEPIDFAAAYRTSTGLYGPGRVLATHLDCTTGMVSMIAFGRSFDWRTVSERAIVVHRPREACIDRGFEPQF
ncbi:MAG: hypothetical protein AAF826_02335 [Pseudomonadota bacterium]